MRSPKMQLTSAASAAAPNESRYAASARGEAAAAQKLCQPSLPLFTNTAESGMRTISDSHRIVTPSDSPNPGSGKGRFRRAPGITNSSEVEVETAGKGVALRLRANWVQRRIVAPEVDPVEHQLGVGIEVPVEAGGDARRRVPGARQDRRVRKVEVIVAKG